MTTWRALPGHVLLGIALLGCRGAIPAADEVAHDPQRQRVIEFWKELNAATSSRTRGDIAEAARRYEAALALDAGHQDGLYYLGQCRRELGDPAAARLAFERLLEANPASARGQLALGALFASPDPREPMDLVRAERHLRRAHEINGEETGPVVRLGEVSLVAGRSDEARRWLESALRTNPKSVEAAFLAGYIGWEAGHELSPLLSRLREAVEVEAPTQGVLSEGDRKDAQRVAAPPLQSPVGRLLFGEPIERLRAHGAAGQALSSRSVVDAWRDVRRLRRAYSERARTAPPTAGG